MSYNKHNQSDFRTFQHSDFTTAHSAKIIVEHLSKWIKPNKVVDIGCGNGAWLNAFKEAGAKHILGIDGVWTNPESIVIPVENFIQRDLRHPYSDITEAFDLACSFEVAEHLPEECSDSFVESLTKFSPVILFSAAIPFQGGVGHINEQWQSYWIEKFERKGFVVIDVIRPLIWNNTEVNWWYAQNMFLFVEKNKVMQLGLSNETATTEQNRWNFNIVHPVRILNIEKKLGIFLDVERYIKTMLEKVKRTFVFSAKI